MALQVSPDGAGITRAHDKRPEQPASREADQISTKLKRRRDPARLAAAPLLRCQTDHELVELARAGHEPAFEAIVERYRRPLLRYARRTGAAEAAEDVVQQTFVAAHRAIAQGSAELELRAWLYRVAHNASIDVLRRERGHQPIDESLDGVERPDQALERAQQVRETVAAMQALPKRQRRALVMAELEGRPHAEIASELGTSRAAVRQLVHRARTALRSAASALVPPVLLQRLLNSAREDPARGLELAAAGGAAGLAAKAGAAALATAAVVAVGSQASPLAGQGPARDGERSAQRALGSGVAAGPRPQGYPAGPGQALPPASRRHGEQVRGRRRGAERSGEAAERKGAGSSGQHPGGSRRGRKKGDPGPSGQHPGGSGGGREPPRGLPKGQAKGKERRSGRGKADNGRPNRPVAPGLAKGQAKGKEHSGRGRGSSGAPERPVPPGLAKERAKGRPRP